MKKIRLTDAYKFKGFIPYQVCYGIESDPNARVIRLKRIQKKLIVQFAE